eukprot:4271968-Prymnesium_polylepis.1
MAAETCACAILSDGAQCGEEGRSAAESAPQGRTGARPKVAHLIAAADWAAIKWVAVTVAGPATVTVANVASARVAPAKAELMAARMPAAKVTGLASVRVPTAKAAGLAATRARRRPSSHATPRRGTPSPKHWPPRPSRTRSSQIRAAGGGTVRTDLCFVRPAWR